MTSKGLARPAARPEPFARSPRCGGELVAGRRSGWYIRRQPGVGSPAVQANGSIPAPAPTEAPN